MSPATGPAQRLARRLAGRRPRRWSRGRVVAALLVTALVVGGGAWLVLSSSLLAVRTVDVTGTARLTTGEVLAAADVPTVPLARLDLAAVERRVASLRPVGSVVVTRQWPRSVLIEVRERQPAAAQRYGGAFRLVDGTGVAFATVRRRPAGLPLVSAPAGAPPAALRAAVQVLAGAPPAVRRHVVEARAASRDAVTLRLTRGRTVVWGSPERGERKATVLAALLSRRATVYDVSAPDAPTTRR